MNTLAPVWDVLAYVVLPLWVLAGFADYLCHRASDMEDATGVRESSLHWLMLGEVAVPLLAAVFLKVNALIMAVMIAFLIAHEITGYFDLKLATRTRHVSVLEEQIHSLLEVLPFTAMLLVFILHWSQALALFGMGNERAEWFIGTKPLPSFAELLWPGIAFLVFAVVPYAEEFIRGLRANRPTIASGSHR